MGETEEAWWESGVKKRCNLGLGRDDAAVSEQQSLGDEERMALP